MKRAIIPDWVSKQISAESRGRCLNPTCRALLDDGLNGWRGKCAHIHGERLGSRRFDPALTALQRNSADNLLVLCPTCHDQVDGPEGETRFPAVLLRSWKVQRQRENKYLDLDAIPNLPAIELQRIVRLLGEGALVTEEAGGTELIPPGEKIRFNELSAQVAEEISRGLTQVDRISRLLQYEEVVSKDIAATVSRTIINIYRWQRGQGLRGDKLFRAVQYELCGGVFSDERVQAALAVESYFFEMCDIFERPAP